MAGAYLGGSTIIHAAGATAGVVEEALRGERNVAAFPGYHARGRHYGEPTVWIARGVFKAFVRSVRKSRAQDGLTDFQKVLLDGFLLQSARLLRTPARKWAERHGVAAALHVAELKARWEKTRPR